MKKLNILGIVISSLLVATQASAAISQKDADRLKGDLTPMGAVRAANSDGSIPAWTGQAVKQVAGYNSSKVQHHPDPFANEKPLFVIDASNVEKYADNLTAGQLALFKSYPDTFKMPVYPSHRTATVPKWVEENTYKVSQTAEMEADGNGVNNARAAVPFPIPKNGLEVVWNHLLRFQGIYRLSENFIQITPDIKGRYATDRETRYDYFPYYDEKRKDDGKLMMFMALQKAPAAVNGDAFLFHDYINPTKNPRNIWRYFSGQRRVRRAPVFIYDTPIPPSYGYRTIDSLDVFFGSPDRYNWKLVGKKEVYIPYNNNRLQSSDLKVKDIATKFHIDPQYTRYEKHRVWEVVGELKEGKRHIYKTRKFYIDEDTWSITIADLYDEHDELWRVTMNYLKNYSEVPVTWGALEVHHDLIARRYNALPFMNEAKRTHDFSQKPPKDSFFTPASMRRLGSK